MKEIEHQLKKGVYTLKAALVVEKTLLTLARKANIIEATHWANHLEEARSQNDTEEREYALLELYRTLHTAGSGYSQEEKKILEEQKGLHGLSGGLTPLFMAATLLTPATRMVDLGAGNGLQGLILQMLVPHCHTLQVELSQSHIAMGRRYQSILGLSENKMSWHQGDLFEAPLGKVTFLYLYRPVRPSETTRPLYARLAHAIEDMVPPPMVMSVADCLTPHFKNPQVPLYQSEFITITLPANT